MATADARIAPPLERVLPYVVSGVSAAVSIASTFARFVIFLFSIASRIIGFLSPLPIILYLLAPVFVFVDVIADTFIRWPYAIALYVSDAFYPIYVFFGVACIIGLLIGGAARLLSTFLVNILVVEEPPMSTLIVEEKSKGRRLRSRSRRRRQRAMKSELGGLS